MHSRSSHTRRLLPLLGLLASLTLAKPAVAYNALCQYYPSLPECWPYSYSNPLCSYYPSLPQCRPYPFYWPY